MEKAGMQKELYCMWPTGIKDLYIYIKKQVL